MDPIRVIDVLVSFLFLLILAPLFFIVALAIKITSRGPVFYQQSRVGKGGKDFKVYKFRSMKVNADKQGLLTVGGRDQRITSIGYYLRKLKLDELPQLFNVLAGEMSVVGPRPEVRKYVDLYNKEQQKVLSVLPGITDHASIAFRNENDLLAKAINSEEYYIKQIMPEKIRLNFFYINNRTIKEYFTIIFKTIITTLQRR